MNWLDFSKYENKNSKFISILSNDGRLITFSYLQKGRSKEYFTLSIESFLTCLKDILNNHSSFIGNENYNEKKWQDLGNTYYTDSTVNNQSIPLTKAIFATLSKIIMWANDFKYNFIDPEEYIVLDKDSIQEAIYKLTSLVDAYPRQEVLQGEVGRENIIYSDHSIRDFAKYVFTYFFGESWSEVLSQTTRKHATHKKIDFYSHDFDIFIRIIGEFSSLQTKETLTSSKTIRYFVDPIYINEGRYYYFSTQWNGEGNYSLSFSNLKIYFENRFSDYLLEKRGEKYFLIKSSEDFNTAPFLEDISQSGLVFSNELINRFVASLLTKPFVLLTGLSGSGKTKIAQSFARWISEDKSQYKIIPVGSDWTNREPLLGYPNGLKFDEYILPDSGALRLIIEASKEENQQKPYFLILDEMNLSHVERYFADFLSVMESDEEIMLYSGKQRKSSDGIEVPSKISWPKNLFVIGTVNIDETTYMFSPKVLDRANTIEFRIDDKNIKSFLGQPSKIDLSVLDGKGATMAQHFLALAQDNQIEQNKVYTETFVKFFNELKKIGAEFGYRTAIEMLLLIKKLNTVGEFTKEQSIDIALIQKLLPKLHGSRSKISKVLDALIILCLEDGVTFSIAKSDEVKPEKILYPIAFEKLVRMYRNALDNGFTSYAEA
ncbi:MAG: hypothetical protein BGO34_08370 [Bacteroidia bacterium 44-10]|nr:MAG: hypothetical protein BGO34_08370 [Bacteroidia bacterium 44-10]